MTERARAALRLQGNLRRLLLRDEPLPWSGESDFPWSRADFGRRVLREHLDESQPAATRVERERRRQVDWILEVLELEPGDRILDAACGPGLYLVDLAERGLCPAGFDINLAAIREAKRRLEAAGVTPVAAFVADLRQPALDGLFRACLLLYGQLAPFPPDQAREVLAGLAAALEPGGELILELLDPSKVDREDGSWWFLDDSGVWADGPFLHLGERRWNEELDASVERYSILHLETGRMDSYQLCDQSYDSESLGRLLDACGLKLESAEPRWAGVELYDADEWIVYRCRKRP